MDELEKSLRKFAEVETDVPLSTMTTLRIGGKAGYVVYPDNTVSFDGIMRIIRKYNVPYKVLGNGSNLLCSDKPFEGVVVSLRRFDDYYFDDCRLIAQAGCSIIALSYQCLQESLSGLEFASGIPATVGGVTYMNAGAYRSDMSAVIEGVFVYRDGRFEWLPGSECEFGYRTSIFQKHPDWIIIAVQMHLVKKDQKEIREIMDSRRERRMASQPLDKPSCGSVFRNPDDIPAWKLIEGIGYRGHRCGGAMVSPKHVNFIVNEDHASAVDFLTLVEEIQDKVREKYGIDLYTEVEKFNW